MPESMTPAMSMESRQQGISSSCFLITIMYIWQLADAQNGRVGDTLSEASNSQRSEAIHDV